MSNLRADIETAINRNSAENGSGTPDHILGAFLTNCLAAFDMAVRDRDEWWGHEPRIGGLIPAATNQDPESGERGGA